MQTTTELSSRSQETELPFAEQIISDVTRLGAEFLHEAEPYNNGVVPAAISKSKLNTNNIAYNFDLTHQPSGAFKYAAAYAAVYFAVKEAEGYGEIIEEAHVGSAGNAGDAFAHACALYGIKPVVHTPVDASEYKLAKLVDDGAEIRPVYRDVADALEGARHEGNKPGRWEFHPFDRIENLAGLYATIGQETVRLVQGLRLSENAIIRVVTPFGGGSFAAAQAIALHEADLENVELWTAEVEETINGMTYTKEQLAFCDGTAAKTGKLTGAAVDYLRHGSVKVRTDQVAALMRHMRGEPAGLLSRAGTHELARQDQDPYTIYVDFLTGNNVSERTKEQAAALAMRGCGLSPV